ncbi:MAG: Fe-S cluster assembly protein SufD [Acidimicrobiales bacterium]
MGSNTFSADAVSAISGPAWLRDRRAEAWTRFAAAELPTEAEEVWRYSRINDLDLDLFRPVAVAGAGAGAAEPPPELAGLLEAAGHRAGLVVVRNGRVVSAELDPALAAQGVVFGSFADGGPGQDCLGSVAAPVDAFVDLASAFMVDGVMVDVPRGVVVADPLVVVQVVDAEAGAVFPRLVVRVGETAQATVLELSCSPEGQPALVASVVELDVADAGNLAYLGLQQFGGGVWQIGYQASRVGRDARLESSAVALGGTYARLRVDTRLVGQGGTSALRAAYFGDGSQMHDFRTMQDHVGPKTTSELLFKGAVQDDSHAVYSGMIRVRPGAAGTNAFQTNRNLVLGQGAHADSVPNLEIEENDVRCSHASAVGPIDEDQRYYLESRGVPPEIADRLIVLGFFDEIVDASPVPGLRAPLREALAAKLVRSAA